VAKHPTQLVSFDRGGAAMNNVVKLVAISGVLCSCLAHPALAAEPIIVIQADGTAWYVAGDGTPTQVVTQVVFPPGNTPNPKPPTGDKPTPQPSETRRLVRDAAVKIDDVSGAKIMAKTYELLAKYIGNGTIPSDANSVDKAVTEAAKRAIKLLPDDDYEEDWEDLHRVVMDELAKLLVANGGNLTADQWSKFFSDASNGCNDAAIGAAIPGILEPLIAVLVQILIKLLTEMFA
jgi:hypothetical protein